MLALVPLEAHADRSVLEHEQPVGGVERHVEALQIELEPVCQRTIAPRVRGALNQYFTEERPVAAELRGGVEIDLSGLMILPPARRMAQHDVGECPESEGREVARSSRRRIVGPGRSCECEADDDRESRTDSPVHGGESTAFPLLHRKRRVRQQGVVAVVDFRFCPLSFTVSEATPHTARPVRLSLIVCR